MRIRLPVPGNREFDLEAPVEGDVLLVVRLAASSATITPTGGGSVVARGRGRARLRLVEEAGRLVAEFGGMGVAAEIEGPARAVAVAASVSSVYLRRGRPLEYVSLRLSSSSARVEAGLLPGGGARVEAMFSSARIILYPEAEGEYWLDIEARGASLSVETPEGSAILLEDGDAPSVSVASEKSRREGAKYVFRARVRARGAAVRLS